MELRQIAEMILAVPPKGGRRIIAIAGPPASGKSTLAENLHSKIPNSRVLPMDGFHRSNDDLERHGLLARKGAPETFDVVAFSVLIQNLRCEPTSYFPTFDRSGDCVVPNGGMVKDGDVTILVEGNYLLLDIDPWNQLFGLWDFTIMLDVPQSELEKRLVTRWREQGYDQKGAKKRAFENDIPNALKMKDHSVDADITIS